MLETLLIGIVWAAFLLCAVPALKRRRFVLLGGALSLAATLTLQTDDVYGFVDAALGGVNLTNLVYRTAGMICVACFDLLIFRALNERRTTRRPWGLWAATSAGVIAQTTLFLSHEWPVTSAHLDEYQDDSRIIAYQSIFWLAVGAVAAHAGFAALKDTRGRPWTSMRTGVTLIGFGALPALLWCAGSIVEVWLDLTSLRPLNQILIFVTAACVCLGLTITAMPGVAEVLAHLSLIARTRSSWLRARAAAPEVSLNSSLRLPVRELVTSTSYVLYRRWIEIEDAARLNKIVLSPKEQHTLARIARLMDADSEQRSPMEDLTSASVGPIKRNGSWT